MATAQALNVPNTFQAGMPARAAEVNQNFDAIENAVNNNTLGIAELVEKIDTLEARIGELEALLVELEGNSVLDLDGYLSLGASEAVNIDGGDKPEAIFSGLNVRVINGTGLTETANGLGNVIIGYGKDGDFSHDIFDDTHDTCSLGRYLTYEDCIANGFYWHVEHFSGSHNLLIGERLRYSQYGGIVTGYQNTSNNAYASVLGGRGSYGSGEGAVVAGGYSNRAIGDSASVGGGHANRAFGTGSAIAGGFSNEATGANSSIAGGYLNVVSGEFAHVSGGLSNTAAGSASTVSGGKERSALGMLDWVAGSLTEDE
jgi:hypothetical protein